MVYDADSATYPKNKKGASKEAGHLAWHPGPAGPDGNYKTNLWTWSDTPMAGYARLVRHEAAPQSGVWFCSNRRFRLMPRPTILPA